MRLTAIITVFCLRVLALSAQERCGTMPYWARLEAGSPRATSVVTAADNASAVPNNSASVEQATADFTRIVIPVVVHVLYRTEQENISDDQIRSQIEALNADFNGENADIGKVPPVFSGRAGRTEIRFALARVDPQGRATNGIVRRQTGNLLWINDDRIKSRMTGGSDPWDTRQYLNIWIGNMSSSLLGFSTFPGASPEKDGVVIRYDVFGTRGRLTTPWNKGRTLTHELGHWLGLRHLWGDTPCGDDGVEDTPRQRAGNRGTPVFPLRNNGCDNGPDGDMFMNFMDFSDDQSLLMFTHGQAGLMRAQFNRGGARQGLLSSRGLGEPWNLTPETIATQEAGMRIYPNPAQATLNVRRIDALMDVPYSITDASGRVLQAGMLKSRDASIDLSGLRSGAYILSSPVADLRFVKQD